MSLHCARAARTPDGLDRDVTIHASWNPGDETAVLEDLEELIEKVRHRIEATATRHEPPPITFIHEPYVEAVWDGPLFETGSVIEYRASDGTLWRGTVGPRQDQDPDDVRFTIPLQPVVDADTVTVELVADTTAFQAAIDRLDRRWAARQGRHLGWMPEDAVLDDPTSGPQGRWYPGATP